MTRSSLAAFGFAVVSVPVVKVTLLFWQYRLHLPLLPFIEAVALVLALSAALFAVSCFPGHLITRLFRSAALVVWSGFAYFIVAFFLGCFWAPACLQGNADYSSHTVPECAPTCDNSDTFIETVEPQAFEFNRDYEIKTGTQMVVCGLDWRARETLINSEVQCPSL